MERTLILFKPDCVQRGLVGKILSRFEDKGLGVVAMKTLMGARLNDMRPYEWGGATFAQRPDPLI